MADVVVAADLEAVAVADVVADAATAEDKTFPSLTLSLFPSIAP